MNNRSIHLEIGGGEQTCYTVPIGPTHPALKEPIRFTFDLSGEQIVGVDIKPGFAHRGIEYMGMRRNVIQTLYLSERICGICSISHPLAFTQAVENAAGIEVPPRAQYIRTIIGELERIHSHLLWAGVGAHELGFDTLLHLTWNVREKCMDLLEQLTGNRVDYAIPIFGGVRRDIPAEKAPLAYQALEYYKDLLQQMIDAYLHDKSVRMRTRNVGVMTYDQAVELCAVGPTTRASGVKKDVRVDMPYLAYADMDLHAITPEDFGTEPIGDVYDNIIVRLLEVAQSIEIIEFCLENMPEGELTSIPKVPALLAAVKKAKAKGSGDTRRRGAKSSTTSDSSKDRTKWPSGRFALPRTTTSCRGFRSSSATRSPTSRSSPRRSIRACAAWIASISSMKPGPSRSASRRNSSDSLGRRQGGCADDRNDRERSLAGDRDPVRIRAPRYGLQGV